MTEYTWVDDGLATLIHAAEQGWHATGHTAGRYPRGKVEMERTVPTEQAATNRTALRSQLVELFAKYMLLESNSQLLDRILDLLQPEPTAQQRDELGAMDVLSLCRIARKVAQHVRSYGVTKPLEITGLLDIMEAAIKQIEAGQP